MKVSKHICAPQATKQRVLAGNLATFRIDFRQFAKSKDSPITAISAERWWKIVVNGLIDELDTHVENLFKKTLLFVVDF